MPKPPKRSQDEILEDLSKPAAFAANVLGINLYDWQRKVLRDLEQRDCRVALRAANGSGKTTLIRLLTGASGFAWAPWIILVLFSSQLVSRMV